MGYYANDAVDRELHDMIDDLEDGDIDDTHFSYGRVVYTMLEFKSIKAETEKAWCLVMIDDNELWFPKSKCSISGNLIATPDWLKNKIM